MTRRVNGALGITRPTTIVFIVALIALGGCDNMQHQSNERAFTPSGHFADGTSARRPPANVVARGELAADDPKVSGLHNGAPVTELPIPLTRALLERGRERFNIICSTCHGEDGHGRGIVVRRGFPAPPSFHDERLRAVAIGHFVDVISRGYGVMYPYAERVAPEDRWAIAAYIRALQRSQHATLADVPSERRADLFSP